MWIFTKEIGFFSIVQNDLCKTDELIVRARSRTDIEKLQAKLLDDYKFNGKIIDTPLSDYAHRMFVPKEIMAKHMAQAVRAIDYDNFKDTISSKDRLRHDAYYESWEAMHSWQGKLGKVGSKGK